MSHQSPPGGLNYPSGYVQQQAPPAKKKVRVFTWIIVAINLLFLVWMIFGIAGVANSSCQAGMTQQNCDAAKAIGGGVGAILIIFLWVAADIILGIIWLVTRKKAPTIVYVSSRQSRRDNVGRASRSLS